MKNFSVLFYLSVAPLVVAQDRGDNTVVLDEASVRNLAIETIQAEESTFESLLFTLGEIEPPCESHSVVASRIPGRIVEVNLHEGEFATKGEIVARVESRQAGSPPPIIELAAPADGLVISSETHLGAPVEPEVELMVIQDISTVWAVARVPQNEASILTSGLVARVKIPALGDDVTEAKFLRLGPEADATAGTVDAIFVVPNPQNRIRPGMRAEVSLVSKRREGVMSIPRVALQGDHANRFVFVRDYEIQNGFVRTPVSVGEFDSEKVEVTTGLLPGDEVVTRGAYSLSFAGKGNTSLKDALDAAHGHSHNEDGSEKAGGEGEAESSAVGGDGAHAHSGNNALTLFLGVACAVLLILLIASPFIFRARAKA